MIALYFCDDVRRARVMLIRVITQLSLAHIVCFIVQLCVRFCMYVERNAVYLHEAVPLLRIYRLAPPKNANKKVQDDTIANHNCFSVDGTFRGWYD
jgi:hypothetical protein